LSFFTRRARLPIPGTPGPVLAKGSDAAPEVSADRPGTADGTTVDETPDHGATLDDTAADDADATVSEGGTATDDGATSGGMERDAADRRRGDEARDGDGADDGTGERKEHPVRARVTMILATVFVLFALNSPDRLTQLSPGAFVRIPLEALFVVAVLLILPARAKRVVAAGAGVTLGLLTIVKITDMGFYAVLDRPFNPGYDVPLLSAGADFLDKSVGRAGEIGAIVGIGALVAAVLTFMTLSVLRLTRLVVRHNTAATRSVAVLGVTWIGSALLGVQAVPGVPVAGFAYNRPIQVVGDLQDHKAFAAQVAVDAFRGTPGQNLLTALRGKNVILAFVESYGRAAVESPRFAPQVDAVLDAGTRRLNADGYASRSAFLTSPTAGGGSWLAHSTLLSGVWVNNQQRYSSLIKTKRTTLIGAFQRAGWRTVNVTPGTTSQGPEEAFYGYNQVYDRWHLGYRGPRFNWGTPPDQFSLSLLQQSELAKPHHAPVMAEIPLVSSHSPWAPRPEMIDWKKVGDGSVYGPMAAAADQPGDVWRDFNRVRTAYRSSIEYSLNALISYVETYGDKNLVLIFLGDHQAAPLVIGGGTDHDVPITIVARDRSVLDRISGWGWQDGLRPGPKAPVWPMNAFRDRFLTAFGSTPQPTPSPPAK
jgi:hypothetical protein